MVWGGLMVVWWRFGVSWGGLGCFNGPSPLQYILSLVTDYTCVNQTD